MIKLSKIIIKGGNQLKGEVKISGSKNSALPIMAACILCDDNCKIIDVPAISDVYNMSELLNCLDIHTEFKNNVMEINASNSKSDSSCCEVVNRLRASFLVFGPLLAKTGNAKIALPGGCAIGARPIDLHIKGLKLMGAEFQQKNGFVEAKCKKRVGANVYLDFPSVGATENLIMAGSLADGKTVIENAATEPEIVDLANFINKMGGRITGAGTDKIEIDGVKTLKGCEYKIIPDRIEAGTFITAAAITKGNIIISNVNTEHLRPVIAKMTECGVVINEKNDCIAVSCQKKITSKDIKTLPYPGFPTDMQGLFCSLMTIADGTSMIVETIFENRFMHISELNKMGANIKIDGRTAVIEGVGRLNGAKVNSTDLRAGGALVVAGLCANGETEIDNYFHIERGYENFVEKLTKLGADILTI